MALHVQKYIEYSCSIYTHLWKYIALMFNNHYDIHVFYFKIQLVFNSINTPAHNKALSEQTITMLKSTQPLLYK